MSICVARGCSIGKGRGLFLPPRASWVGARFLRFPYRSKRSSGMRVNPFKSCHFRRCDRTVLVWIELLILTMFFPNTCRGIARTREATGPRALYGRPTLHVPRSQIVALRNTPMLRAPPQPPSKRPIGRRIRSRPRRTCCQTRRRARGGPPTTRGFPRA